MLRKQSLWEDERMSMAGAIETSITSLNAYATDYDDWSIAYSGGKDSSATVSFVIWAIRTGRVPAPRSLTVLYADTRQELPPLAETAHRLINDLNAATDIDITAKVVLPEIDNRFYVYMLGRGVPPPSNTFRWCTERIKIKPMADELQRLSRQVNPDIKQAWHEAYRWQLRGHDEIAAQIVQDAHRKFLQITGVRLGESANRDTRIAVSCNSSSGECGQGWFQEMNNTAISDTLAPLVHWRTCYVWDWLHDWHSNAWAKACGYDQGHGFEYLENIAVAYGDQSNEARTGCIGCNLASRDVALENLVGELGYGHLQPLMAIKPMFKELKQPENRLRKAAPERRKDGAYKKNGQRLGPLTMEARAYALGKVLDIQKQAEVDLINDEEEARIRELWKEGTWPQGWEGGLENDNHVVGDVPLDQITVVGDHELVVQPPLFT